MTMEARRLKSRPRAKNGRITNSQYETLSAFRYALRRFMHFSEEAARAAGITGQQYQALLAMKGFPSADKLTVGGLAQRLQLRHHSAVGLVDRLVAEKLVVRVPSTKDHREVIIRLTVRGETIVEKIAFLHREQFKQIGPEFSRLLEQIASSEE
jgi:DNA-binding MarR family transcriptional regulator